MTAATITPSDSDVFTSIKAFVVGVLGINPAQVVQGLQNRVPAPAGSYVILTALFDNRLRTNLETWDITNPNPTEISAENGMMVAVQIDCYGVSSHDWARTLCTLWRDDYGAQALASIGAPLYADEPRQMPYTDGEAQNAQRWLIDARLQVNFVVSTPMQFGDTIVPNLVNVDERYPPT